MKNKKVLLLVAVAATAIAAHLCILKKLKERRRMAIVSDAGYETAYDIHFPLKYKK
jgi:hypothetical protein